MTGVLGRPIRPGTADYFNCPLNRDEYETFVQALVTARRLHSIKPIWAKKTSPSLRAVFLEVMAKRGKDALRYGPFRPVGLSDGKVSVLRCIAAAAENTEATLFNLVGCQLASSGESETGLSTHSALQEAEFVRYGVMHRNTFINSLAGAPAKFPV